MSQHHFTTQIVQAASLASEALPYVGQPAQIRCGFDRPLLQFFLSILAQPDTEAEDSLYDSLFEVGGGLAEAEQIEQVCKHFGVCLPVGLVSQLQAEERQNIGNRVVMWDAGGFQVQYEETPLAL
ncbi:hypothetical protein [Hymenobacter guriensis]|uniref:Uncharacterized protein n=1 Tax=Hymenobacter guriensis TaxID=2793065 RepID=A0ABS0L4H5_9BACT|nr:hypothetical protein [Hymenobacter guriensis]MBG8555053.1 hypothetical protein [Hymenobacter guriensis]